MKYFQAGLSDGSVTTAKLADLAVTRIKLGPNSVVQSKVYHDQVSLAGSIGAALRVDLVLLPNAYWPNLHTDVGIRVTGHLTDGSVASPRLGLKNTDQGNVRTYDVDARHVLE